MNCSHAQMMFSAWLDKQLSVDDHSAIQEHLRECGDCRNMAEQLAQDDRLLRQAFAAPRASAEQKVARIVQQFSQTLADPGEPSINHKPVVLAPSAGASVAAEGTVSLSTRRMSPRGGQFWSMLGGLAAGFLIAALIFQPWNHERERPQPDLVAETADHSDIEKPAVKVAQVTHVVGPVEMKSPQANNWFVCPADSPVLEGCALRTMDDTLCELSTSSGGQVRMSAGTEVSFSDQDEIRLTKGRMWFSARNDKVPMEVEIPPGKIVAKNAVFDVSCLDQVTILTVASGELTLASAGSEVILTERDRITWQGNQIRERERVFDTLLDTRWVNRLLLDKGPNDEEFNQRINEILASMGEAKVSWLYESEIRALGSEVVLPLVRFLESSRSASNQELRSKAGLLVGDLADSSHVPSLIGLLNDENAEVRFHAARALQRLTAEDQGWTVEQWKTEPVISCQSTSTAWENWLKENKDRYPDYRAPESIPFKKKG